MKKLLLVGAALLSISSYASDNISSVGSEDFNVSSQLDSNISSVGSGDFNVSSQLDSNISSVGSGDFNISSIEPYLGGGPVIRRSFVPHYSPEEALERIDWGNNSLSPSAEKIDLSKNWNDIWSNLWKTDKNPFNYSEELDKYFSQNAIVTIDRSKMDHRPEELTSDFWNKIRFDNIDPEKPYYWPDLLEKSFALYSTNKSDNILYKRFEIVASTQVSYLYSGIHDHSGLKKLILENTDEIKDGSLAFFIYEFIRYLSFILIQKQKALIDPNLASNLLKDQVSALLNDRTPDFLKNPSFSLLKDKTYIESYSHRYLLPDTMAYIIASGKGFLDDIINSRREAFISNPDALERLKDIVAYIIIYQCEQLDKTFEGKLQIGTELVDKIVNKQLSIIQTQVIDPLQKEGLYQELKEDLFKELKDEIKFRKTKNQCGCLRNHNSIFCRCDSKACFVHDILLKIQAE